ncbi:MAG: LysR family transcriptional regulator [Porticoccaceae bacterium]
MLLVTGQREHDLLFELHQLNCFIVVAEELHFGKAAARLNMTQPPLSRQIQVLEHKMGVSLFNRSSRSVALTPTGLSFLPEARRIHRSGRKCCGLCQTHTRRYDRAGKDRFHGGYGVRKAPLFLYQRLQ